MPCPADLRQLYRERRVIPFIGAGASMAVDWTIPGDDARARGPSWSEVVDYATRYLGSDRPDLLRLRGSDLQILEYFSIKAGGFAPLTNWLATRFSQATDRDILSCPLHRSLASLERCHVYYTTNYDDFLERALGASGRNVTVVSDERNMNHDRQIVEVVKFHGDFNTPDKMVLSESHYMSRMRLESPMDLKLRADMLGRAVLFIGYSFGDPNVNYLFHVVNHLFSLLPESSSGRRAYIVLFDPSDFERRLFRQRNIEVISIPGPISAAKIADLLDEMAA